MFKAFFIKPEELDEDEFDNPLGREQVLALYSVQQAVLWRRHSEVLTIL